MQIRLAMQSKGFEPDNKRTRLEGPGDAVEVSTGFPPVAASDAKVLILGSLPGRRSLEAAQYYAHRQNAFWRIMAELFGITGDYESRCEQLTQHRIALWDVLASSVRPGSMDADIRLEASQPNDFREFLSRHAEIARICFNGRKAEEIFRRYVVPGLIAAVPNLVSLPSTSPAYAAMAFDEKRDAWFEKLGLPNKNL